MSAWLSTGGLWMLLALGGLVLTTGLPLWSLLIGVASAFSVLGWVVGAMDVAVLASAPQRLVGLLENDLLQALPLYVFMGILLQKLPVGAALYATLSRLFGRVRAGDVLAALGVGALIAPMNGSVAASASLLSNMLRPRVEKMQPAHAITLVGLAATIGVVVPPSLVLVLLGDAMMRAHTEASHLGGSALHVVRIINTRDVLNAAALPALLLLLAWSVVAVWCNRAVRFERVSVTGRQMAMAALSAVGIVALLGMVFVGWVMPVEAAATGCVLLVLITAISRALSGPQWAELLHETLVLSGALMALLVGATIFSLVFRLWGTDQWLSDLLLAATWPPRVMALCVLVFVALCAWVLDAFEMIFVLLPIVAPPLIVMLGDAQQVAVLLLLVLQLSFLLPPLGYALVMARAGLHLHVSLRQLFLATAPFLLLQTLALALVFVFPAGVHTLDADVTASPQLGDEAIEAQMRAMSEGDAAP